MKSDRPNYIRLEPGEVYQVALKYTYPTKTKGFTGPEYRWILTDGRALYTPLDFFDRIKELGIVPGQKFEIERVYRGRIRAYHLPEFCGPSQAALLLEGSSELSEPSESIRAGRETDPGDRETMRGDDETELGNALITAVRASTAAEARASLKGQRVRFSPADIREMGIALYRVRKQRAS